MTRTLVLFNPAAGGGRAARQRGRVERALGEGPAQIVPLDPPGRWESAVQLALASDVRSFVAAGGDGTVSALVNTLVAVAGQQRLEGLTLGAVALGSSNDFHKPPMPTCSNRLPGGGGPQARIDPGHTRPRDICRARFTDGLGRRVTRHFIISASMGVTATANALFNRGEWAQRSLKRLSPSLAIVYAALRAIARHESLEAMIWPTAGSKAGRAARLTNLSLLKTPFLSGTLRFDTPVADDDGLLSANLCDGLGRARLLRTLADLSRGRFLGRPGCSHWSTPWLKVEADRPVPLELDGEVFTASSVTFDVLPQQMEVCQ